MQRDGLLRRLDPQAVDERAAAGEVLTQCVAAPAGAGNVELKPGMTEAEVVRALGAPQKKVAFGAKTIWSYEGFTITMVNGKVTDVK